MCASMFDLKNLKDAFGTAFKERPHGLRKYIILLTIIFVLEILLQNGQHSTTFLFVRKGMWIVIVFAISNFYLIGFLCKSICTYIRTRTTLLVHSVNWFHRFHEIFFHVQMSANFSIFLFCSVFSRIRKFTIDCKNNDISQRTILERAGIRTVYGNLWFHWHFHPVRGCTFFCWSGWPSWHHHRYIGSHWLRDQFGKKCQSLSCIMWWSLITISIFPFFY